MSSSPQKPRPPQPPPRADWRDLPPAWAQVADLVCCVLALLAASVAATGGFRLHAGALHLSVTSASRIWVWAAGLLVARHAVWRRIPIHAHLRRRWADWTRSPHYRSFVAADPLPVGEPTPRRGRPIVLMLALSPLFAAITAAMTNPQIRHMSDAVHDPGDPLLNLWALAWVAHQAPLHPLQLFHANIYAPERWTLAYSETLLAPSLIASPLLWLGAGRLFVYNLVFLGGFVLSGAGAALLVRDLTRQTGAAIVAGAIFAFLPVRFDHLPQLQLQQAQWIPLALWAFHRVMNDGRVADGLRLGAFVAGQLYSCMYYGIYLACYLTVFGGAVMVTHPSVARRRLAPVAAGIALALLLFAPAARAYLGGRAVVGERGAGEIAARSATWRHYLAAPKENALYGWTAARYGAEERNLFPGLCAAALAAVALWPPWSALRLLYALGLGFAVNLTLGFNAPLYRFLYDEVPVVRALRIPALAVMLAGCALAVLAGFGFARIARRVPNRFAAGMLTVACTAAIVAEGWAAPVQVTPIPSAAPEAYADLVRDAGAAVPVTLVDLPLLVGGDQIYMYYSTFHWQRIVNGYSGFFPASYLEMAAALRRFPDSTSLDALRRRGVQYAVIHGERLDGANYGRVTGDLDRCRCGALVSRRPWMDREISVYRID